MASYTRRRIARLGAVGSAALFVPRAWGTWRATPEQVEGPFYPTAEQADTDLDLTHVAGRAEPATGEVILVRGAVRDVNGAPLAQARVDVWQADHFGRYSHPRDHNPAPLDPNFQGWGIVRTDTAGNYGFKTVRPGPYPLDALGGTGWRCRHVHFKVAHRKAGRLTTQMYFPGDPLIEQDLEIRKAPEALRPLLIADLETDEATGLPLYRFDLVQGADA